jgi:hypothetical protein
MRDFTLVPAIFTMTAMPQRHPLYNAHQTTVSAGKAPAAAPPSSTVAEPAPPAYAIEPAWIDTAGRTRTWALRDPHGTQMAEITTKSAAQKLAQFLNNVMGDERGPAR